MKFKKIDEKRAAQITKETSGDVEFKVVDGTLKGVCIKYGDSLLNVEIDSYSVIFTEPATKEVFKLSFFAQVCEEKIFIEKQFDSEYDRQQYIQQHLYDMPEDEMSLSVATVKDE